MKMMAAASCEQRAPETMCAKEVASNLQKMLAERERQDKMWLAPVATEHPVKPMDVKASNTL